MMLITTTTSITKRNEIDLPLERGIGYLEIASGRRQLISKARSAHLFGLHVAGSGHTKAAGEERIARLLPSQIPFAGQQGLVHLKEPVTEHHTIHNDLVAGHDTQDITFHQFCRGNHLFTTVAHYRNRWPIEERNPIQLALGADLLHGADQGIDQTEPHAGQRVVDPSEGDQGDADGEQDIVEQGE
jgi:hypothetical protein